MPAMVFITENKNAAMYIEIFPSGKVTLNVSVQRLLDPGKVDGACVILTRGELIEVRDAITTLLEE